MKGTHQITYATTFVIVNTPIRAAADGTDDDLAWIVQRPKQT